MNFDTICLNLDKLDNRPDNCTDAISEAKRLSLSEGKHVVLIYQRVRLVVWHEYDTEQLAITWVIRHREINKIY